MVCYLAEVLNQRLVDCQNLVLYDAMSNPAQVYIYAQHMVVAGSSLPGSESGKASLVVGTATTKEWLEDDGMLRKGMLGKGMWR